MSQEFSTALTVGPIHWLHPSPPPSSNLSTSREAFLEMLCFLWNKRRNGGRSRQTLGIVRNFCGPL